MTSGRTFQLVSDFDYDLPTELIAQTPLAERDRSRLMVVERSTGTRTHTDIASLPDWLDPGDLIVANNSRVIPARLSARRAQTGGAIELLLLRRDDDGVWSALARPARRLKPGDQLTLLPKSPETDREGTVDVVGRGDEGIVFVRFQDDVDQRLDHYGVVPLPPYIHEDLDDPNRYQTLYASVPGSAAAPTAGLHISPTLRERLRERGVGWAEVTLHIGLDTFRPVAVEQIAEHRIHSEWCRVTDDVAEQILETKRQGRRVIALGTTAARTLETLGQHSQSHPGRGYTGSTEIFITPGYRWQIVDAMLTNFHLPKSTLMMMISALADRDLILAAYHEAIDQRYRFFSFGDAMLIV